ncbi:hypothetical protein CNECB9_2790005 [Cupriavidus necator]|uniref:Uncharacterized protein n=1 Tax=Cupriavidus necator TaxID=106590 RepID=A0A1K0IT90_CUPNE|nr:hypothetical protein CNECB9_2790005 [Cupriavidus necator]
MGALMYVYASAATGLAFIVSIMISGPRRLPPNAVGIGAVRICKKDGTPMHRTTAIMHGGVASHSLTVHAQANPPIENQGIH